MARRKNRSKPRDRKAQDSKSYGVCAECGKRSYLSRSAARNALRFLHPGDRMSVYQCLESRSKGFDPSPWHIGHADKAVLSGDVDRRDVYSDSGRQLISLEKCAYMGSEQGVEGLRCSLSPNHHGPHLAQSFSGDWITLNPTTKTTEDKEGQDMAPTISELARITTTPKVEEKTPQVSEESPKTSSANIGGVFNLESLPTRSEAMPKTAHEVLYASIEAVLTRAFEHGTSLTVPEIWYRSDFSAFAEGEAPNYSAFATFLRMRVKKGLILVRKETQDERTVRRGVGFAPYNRFANLHALASLTSVVPTVTQIFDEIEPLTQDQQRFARENPAERTTKKPKKVENTFERPKVVVAEVHTPDPDMGPAPIMEQEQEQEQARWGEDIPYAALQGRVLELEQQVSSLTEKNARLRQSIGSMAGVIESLTD